MKLTPIFIFIIIAAIAAYDVWVIVVHGSHESISGYIIEWSYAHPVFSFVMGFVMGHLFWRMKRNERTKEIDK